MSRHKIRSTTSWMQFLFSILFPSRSNAVLYICLPTPSFLSRSLRKTPKSRTSSHFLSTWSTWMQLVCRHSRSHTRTSVLQSRESTSSEQPSKDWLFYRQASLPTTESSSPENKGRGLSFPLTRSTWMPHNVRAMDLGELLYITSISFLRQTTESLLQLRLPFLILVLYLIELPLPQLSSLLEVKELEIVDASLLFLASIRF